MEDWWHMSESNLPQDTHYSPAELEKVVLGLFSVHANFCRLLLDAWVLLDREGRVLKCNQMFMQMTGAKAQDLRKGVTLQQLLGEDPKSPYLASLISSQTHERLDDIHVFQTRSLQRLQVIASNHPFFDSRGDHVGSCVLLRDVTAEARLQGKVTERTLESLTDSLTSVYARRFLESLYDAEQRQDGVNMVESYSVVMCDIDHFKSLNDRYGHLGGDTVLQKVAEAMRKSCRSTDKVIRYGGEEFLVLLTETPLAGACIAAEKIRRTIEQLRIPFQGHEISVTLSAGVAEVDLGKENRRSVVSRADRALYTAKNSGRNCVFVGHLHGPERFDGHIPSDSENMKAS